MAHDLTIAMEVFDRDVARSLAAQLQSLAGLQVAPTVGPAESSGLISLPAKPNIIFVDDASNSVDTCARLSDLRGKFPQAAIFLVSADKRPKHIVDVMKAGATEFLPVPVDADMLRASIEDIRGKIAADGKIGQGKIYSFISSKGGLGSTVIAVNSAVALSGSKGTSVALCDMSFQSGDSSVLLDLVPAASFADVSGNIHRLDASLLKGYMARHKSGIDLLAAPPHPEQSEEIRAEHMEKTFGLLGKLYDHVVVDCASMFIDECTVEAFNASHKIFIVTDMSVPAIRNAARLRHSVGKLGIAAAKVEFVINRYAKNGTLSIEEIEQTLGKRIFWIFPNDFIDIVSSINRGVPLVRYNPQAPFAKNVFDFSQNLLSAPSTAGYRGIRGAFGKAI